jgi:hypothetical protein
LATAFERGRDQLNKTMDRTADESRKRVSKHRESNGLKREERLKDILTAEEKHLVPSVATIRTFHGSSSGSSYQKGDPPRHASGSGSGSEAFEKTTPRDPYAA